MRRKNHIHRVDFENDVLLMFQMRLSGDGFALEAAAANPHWQAGKPEENERNREPSETSGEAEEAGKQRWQRHWGFNARVGKQWRAVSIHQFPKLALVQPLHHGPQVCNGKLPHFQSVRFGGGRAASETRQEKLAHFAAAPRLRHGPQAKGEPDRCVPILERDLQLVEIFVRFAGIELRRCLNANIVGQSGKNKRLESSGGSSGIGSDHPPSPESPDTQESRFHTLETHSTSGESRPKFLEKYLFCFASLRHCFRLSTKRRKCPW